MNPRIDAELVASQSPSADEQQESPEFRSATSPGIRQLFLYLNTILCVALACVTMAAIAQLDPGRVAILNVFVYGTIIATVGVVVGYIWFELKSYVSDNLKLQRVLGAVNLVFAVILLVIAALPVIVAVARDVRTFKGLWLVGTLAGLGAFTAICGRLRMWRPIS